MGSHTRGCFALWPACRACPANRVPPANNDPAACLFCRLAMWGILVSWQWVIRAAASRAVHAVPLQTLPHLATPHVWCTPS